MGLLWLKTCNNVRNANSGCENRDSSVRGVPAINITSAQRSRTAAAHNKSQFFNFDDLDLSSAKDKPYFTDRPRNSTTVNYKAKDWTKILPYKPSKVPSDALWMPILALKNETKNYHLPNDKVGFVYSAFLDTRFPEGPFVRVMAYAHKNVKEFFCTLHPGEADKWRRKRAVVKAEVEIQWPVMLHKPQPYLALFINCQLRTVEYTPASVTISLSKEAAEWALSKGHRRQLTITAANNVYVHGEGTPRNTPSLCMCSRILQAFGVPGKPQEMRCMDDWVRLVEFIELHSIMGASVFHFYGQCYSQKVMLGVTKERLHYILFSK